MTPKTFLYALILATSAYTQQAHTSQRALPASQTFPNSSFRLLTHSVGPRICEVSTGEPVFDLYTGPYEITPVLFPDNTDQRSMPHELASPVLYRQSEALWLETRHIYLDCMAIGAQNPIHILHTAHAAACKPILSFKENMQKLFATKQAGYTDAELLPLQHLIINQAQGINPLAVAMLRELMQRQKYPHDKDVKTPLLNMIELG